jgi:hypothetical protein
MAKYDQVQQAARAKVAELQGENDTSGINVRVLKELKTILQDIPREEWLQDHHLGCDCNGFHDAL